MQGSRLCSRAWGFDLRRAASCCLHNLLSPVPTNPQSIFELLNSVYAELDDPAAPHFQLCLSILETVSQVRPLVDSGKQRRQHGRPERLTACLQVVCPVPGIARLRLPCKAAACLHQRLPPCRRAPEPRSSARCCCWTCLPARSWCAACSPRYWTWSSAFHRPSMALHVGGRDAWRCACRCCRCVLNHCCCCAAAAHRTNQSNHRANPGAARRMRQC